MNEKLLFIDTTRERLVVALLDGKTPEIRTNPDQRRHSEVLNTVAGDFVPRASAFAVVTGPGSWTGSRVGVTAVKAWAFATGRPVVAMGADKSDTGNLGDFKLFDIAWKKYKAADFTDIHVLAPHYDAEFVVGKNNRA
jgi:hypothetical protein